MSGWDLRAMREGDIADIMDIERLSFAQPWSESAMRQELVNPHAHYTVLEEAGRVVAYAGMWKICDEAHITNIAVHPLKRRQSLGERMLRAFLGAAKEEGIVAATLEVRKGNAPAIALYEKLGFEAAGVRKKFYGDGEDAVVMWCTL